MSQQTPYSPPLAPVRDPAEPEVPEPPAIGWAGICLWTSVSIIVLTSGVALASLPGWRHAGPLIATSLFSVGVLVVVAWQLRAGRGWARWLYLVVYILGSLAFVAGVVLAPQAFLSLPRIDQATLLVQFALQTAALVFMFTPASGRWIRSRT